MVAMIMQFQQSTLNASMDLKAYGGDNDDDDVNDDEKRFLELPRTSSGS